MGAPRRLSCVSSCAITIAAALPAQADYTNLATAPGAENSNPSSRQRAGGALQYPSIGNTTFVLEAGTLAPLAPTFLGFGFVAQTLPLGGGCSTAFAVPVGSVFALSEPSGRARFPVPIPNVPALRGVEFLAQAAIVDPSRGLVGPLTLTQGLRVTIGD